MEFSAGGIRADVSRGVVFEGVEGYCSERTGGDHCGDGIAETKQIECGTVDI